MYIELYKNESPNNHINKDLKLLYTVSVNFKSDLDVSSPEIKLLLDGLDPKIINYIIIPELNRSYFINRFTQINSRIGIFYLDCDLLSTYKTDIINSNALFMRNIKNGDFVNIEETNKYTSSIKKLVSDYVHDDGETMILTSVRGV